MNQSIKDGFDTEVLLFEQAYLDNSMDCLFSNHRDDCHCLEVGENRFLNQNIIFYLLTEGRLNRYLMRLITRKKIKLAIFILRLFNSLKLMDLSQVLVDFNWLDWLVVSERMEFIDTLLKIGMRFNSVEDIHQLFVKVVLNQDREAFVRLCKLIDKSLIDCKECHPIHLIFLLPFEWIEEYWDVLKELRDYEGRNLLMIASMNDQLVLFEQLLEKFGEPSLALTDHNGRNVLHYSVIHGSYSIFNFLTKGCGIPATNSDIEGFSVLFFAAMYDKLEIFQQILSENEDMSILEPSHQPRKPTCYHIAAMHGSIQILNWFLSNKEKYPIEMFKDVDGKYPTMWSMEIGYNLYLVEYFMRNGLVYLDSKHQTFPIMFADLGHCETLMWLSKYKDTFSLKQSNMYDCLSAAANRGHLKIVKYLIEELQFNPEHCEYDGDKNIAHISVASKNKELVEYILQQYPKLALKIDKSGNLPLEYVPYNNLDVSILKLVLPSTDVKTTHPKALQRCLCAASAMGRIDVSRYLIEEMGINPNFSVHPYLTPLTVASSAGQLESVSYLIDHGADPLYVNSEGENILHAIAMHCHFEILKYLESKLSKEVLNKLMNQLLTSSRSSSVNYAIYSLNIPII